ncbi:RusA family crossover junction endodeoxyribonuclease [Collinsella sp. AF08-23]|nr:RusA family crossover junction endodeoxyribonuclease [Collinsella sp. AF08-23]
MLQNDRGDALAHHAVGLPVRTTLLQNLRVAWCFPTEGEHSDGEPHTAKPDMGNMLKTLEDCLVRSGVIADDAIICGEQLSKAWSDPSGIYVEASEL